MTDLKKKLSALPLCPGVYLMKDIEGNIIYVGKSKVLKNRVNSYFSNLSSHTPKTKAMVSQIADFEYILTDSEEEALALECNLIKKHRPKYNILLKDDKQYPYIKITSNEEFPRIVVTRQIKKDGSTYLGPYTTGMSIKEAVEEIRKVFKLRSCKKNINGQNQRYCLYYQLGQCSAPCANKISTEEYNKLVSEAVSVLNGKDDAILSELREKMYNASADLEFEKAAQYRDRIQSINELGQKQKVSSSGENNTDYIGIYKEGATYCIQVFYYRNGNAVGSEYFTLENELAEPSEVAENFVKQFYFTGVKPPREVAISENFEDKDSISVWLSVAAGHKVTFTVPQRGKKAEIIKMVINNARESLYKHRLLQNRSMEKQNRMLSSLSELLDLSAPPFRIESYDISNTSGDSSVGVQVVYVNAIPKKGLYRKYNIKTVEGANDYESMREVLFRRINEAYKEEDMIKAGTLCADKAKFLPLPDLILLDGGKGHVAAAKMLLDTMGEDIPVFGLVKDKTHRTRGITDEYNEFELDKKSELFRFLAGIQDEVHRFAITTFRKRHQKKNIHSELETISGVGSATRIKLMKSFGSVEKIKTASVEELEAVIPRNIAKKVYEHFNG